MRTALPGRRVAGRVSDTLVLERYRLCRRLGAGGFGTVWLARDERLERDVAIKVLPRERLHFARFEREARATARLNHPGIVTLYEAATDDEGAYLVSELVRGHTLGVALEEGQLSDQDILRLAVALCDALEYAHRRGVVHRDVKPSNVLVPELPVTSADLAKLTDFGVARLVGGDSLTRTGDVIGTGAYMAPEQAEGREAHPCADLYSLALVIYEALTGVNPLRLTAPGVRGGRLGVHLPALRRHRRDLPRELAGGIDLALRPRSRERGTVLELRAALVSSLAHVGDRPGVVADPWPSRRRNPTDEPLQVWAGREPQGRHRTWSRAPAPPAERDEIDPDEEPELASEPAAVTGFTRLLCGGAAAAAAAWFATAVLSPSPLVPGLAVLAAALLVMVAPRAGWVGLVGVGMLTLALQDRPGAALVLAVGALPTLILLWRRGEARSWPAITPALALIGLGGVWPALAGRGCSAWTRLTLALSGWVWLLAGELLTGQNAYVRLAPGVQGPRLWTSSLTGAVHEVLRALVSGGLLAPGIVWAGAALILPSVIRRGAWADRLFFLVLWAAAIPLLGAAMLSALRTGASLLAAQAALGAVGCVVLAAVTGALGDARQSTVAPTRGQDSRSMESH